MYSTPRTKWTKPSLILDRWHDGDVDTVVVVLDFNCTPHCTVHSFGMRSAVVTVAHPISSMIQQTATLGHGKNVQNSSYEYIIWYCTTGFQEPVPVLATTTCVRSTSTGVPVLIKAIIEILKREHVMLFLHVNARNRMRCSSTLVVGNQ
jgi:hypothetical protein